MLDAREQGPVGGVAASRSASLQAGGWAGKVGGRWLEAGGRWRRASRRASVSQGGLVAVLAGCRSQAAVAVAVAVVDALSQTGTQWGLVGVWVQVGR